MLTLLIMAIGLGASFFAMPVGLRAQAAIMLPPPAGVVAADGFSPPSLGISAEDAVRRIVEEQYGRYAGDCQTTRSPDDIGAICSKFVVAHASLRAYLVGRTFSEFDHWVFVRFVSAGWMPAATALFGTASPPFLVPWPVP